MSSSSVPDAAPQRRAALVTGGSRGIGAATCRALAADGWDLCIGFRADETAARGVAEACESAGSRAMVHRVDVSDVSSIDALFAALDEQWGSRTLGAL
ncbi:MAG TPA: SDR family NAD(P)-dependent oxidoreductase, partial [Acidimicrobiales bacterium]|nr:SDR family NAD(P)-dependent oxidoreductase [Acidimicrobiales bacterium]